MTQWHVMLFVLLWFWKAYTQVYIMIWYGFRYFFAQLRWGVRESTKYTVNPYILLINIVPLLISKGVVAVFIALALDNIKNWMIYWSIHACVCSNPWLPMVSMKKEGEKERKKQTSNQDNVSHNNTLILTRKSIW